MESTGSVNKIHISEKTYNCLLATNEFILEERGVIDVKGKGKMKTYYLLDYSRENKVLNPVFIDEVINTAKTILYNLKDSNFSTLNSFQNFLSVGRGSVDTSISSNTDSIMKRKNSTANFSSMIKRKFSTASFLMVEETRKNDSSIDNSKSTNDSGHFLEI
jgi:hypothetical protein